MSDFLAACFPAEIYTERHVAMEDYSARGAHLGPPRYPEPVEMNPLPAPPEVARAAIQEALALVEEVVPTEES